MHVAVYPGSFDPLTLGHLDIITRAAAMSDRVIVAIGVNRAKSAQYLPMDERVALIEAALREAGLADQVSVCVVPTLIATFAADHGGVLVKGVRTQADMDYETQMAALNRDIAGVDTIMLPARPELSHISSSAVREIVSFGGDVRAYVPPVIAACLARKEPA